MYRPCPRDLDGFSSSLTKPDTRYRQQLGQDLLAFLIEPDNVITCQDIGQFIDRLLPWIQTSNFKISSLGIEILTVLVDRLGHDFRPYTITVLPVIIDRLGDTKDTVREKSQLFLLKLLEKSVLTPQSLFEKLTPAFTHKNSKIKEEVLRFLVSTLNEYGAHSLTLNRFIPDIVKLLSDPTVTVRDIAFNTLTDLYRHVGEKLRIDLQKRNLVPQAKWPLLACRFDEIKNNDELLPTATKSIELNIDEVDKMATKPLSVKKSAFKPKPLIGNSNAAGAVDEDLFITSFEDVPNMQIFSARDITENLKSIQDIICDANKDWNKRVDALRKIRSIIIAGGTNFEEFFVGLKALSIALQGSIKDLRSQVVRETCITIAYISQCIGSKFDKTAEILLQPLINLIQNSAKIMATSGEVAVKFILKNIHSPRFIPIITNNATISKSKEIRRSCCEFMDIILTHWQTYSLENHLALIQDCVKKGVADADPEARVASRKAYRGFRDHFPDQAEVLLQSLEPSYRRALQGDGMSASSSNSNLNINYKTPRGYGKPFGIHSATGSTENLFNGSGLHRVPSLPRSYKQRSGIPVLSRSDNSANKKGFRSNSAIDLQAAQRAKARAQYSAMARNKIQSGRASLQGGSPSARPKRSTENLATPSPERVGRPKNRNSQSQPTSRSGSPSSRLAFLYNHVSDTDSPRPRRLMSGIPRSTAGSRDHSRETSPNRASSITRYRRGSDRPPINLTPRPVLAQKILQQSREAEIALADAFVVPLHSPNTPALGDPEEIYKSLRRTTAEIQNYSFESPEVENADIIVNKVLQKCCIDHTTSLSEKRILLNEVLDLIRQNNIQSIIVNFKKLLRIFIDHLISDDCQSQIIVLKIIAAIFQNPYMKDTWKDFVELITLRVLTAHCDEKREVVKQAEATAAAMAICPFGTVVHILAPMIQTNPYPENLGAIKMLTKLIEANPEQITDQHLGKIMPGILQGSDHNESSVRKSSIFCMVAIYKAVGEERFALYMNSLTGSKIKLLRFYISRAEHNSVPTSPKNTNGDNAEIKPALYK